MHIFYLLCKHSNLVAVVLVTVTAALSQSVEHYTICCIMASEKIVICGAGFLGIAFNTVILARYTMLTLDMDIKALILPKQLPWRTIPGQH